jgi:hypothetical protein
LLENLSSHEKTEIVNAIPQGGIRLIALAYLLDREGGVGGPLFHLLQDECDAQISYDDGSPDFNLRRLAFLRRDMALLEKIALVGGNFTDRWFQSTAENPARQHLPRADLLNAFYREQQRATTKQE